MNASGLRSWGPAILLLFALGSLVVGAFLVPDGWWALSWIGYAVVGAVILHRRPGNVIGWLLLLVGLSWGINMMLFLALERFPNSVWLEMFTHILGYSSWLVLVLIPVLFPSGRPTDRFTAGLCVWLLVLLSVVILAELVSPAPKELTGQVSPLAVPALAALTDFLLDDGFLVVPLSMALSLGSVVPRWRRARGAERLQFSWFLAGLLMAIAGLTVTQFLADETFQLFSVLFVLSLTLIPLAIGVAVLRYRLYEIDRIVSRTISYGLVIGVVALIYVVGAVWLPSQLLGEQPDLFIAASTLAAAAMFNPLRARIQRLVDRRFNRSRYDAQGVIDAFSSSLRRRVDPSHMEEELAGVVAQTLQPARVGIWFRLPHS
ncbi:MAG TPA: hypothetical protein VJR05_04340 [Acidimicrobiia bacterium]|nr:hypothetical protein [Acidimicrobiia bacterium]